MSEQKNFNSRMRTFLQEYSKFQAYENRDTKNTLFKQISDLIIQSKGIVKVRELEELSGYSSRYINKIFDKELGLSTKQLCNSIKFQFLLDDMNKGIGDSFTSIASEYNFYDQAHFIHEFKEFSGKTPGEYAEEVKNKKYISSIKNI